MQPLDKHNELATFTMPLRGVLANWPITQLPRDALHAAKNVTIRAGICQPRPGLQLFSPTKMLGQPRGAIQAGILAVGGGFQVMEDVANTQAGVGVTNANAVITGVNTTGLVVGMTIYPPTPGTNFAFGTTISVIGVNQVTASNNWTGATGTTTVTFGFAGFQDSFVPPRAFQTKSSTPASLLVFGTTQKLYTATNSSQPGTSALTDITGAVAISTASLSRDKLWRFAVLFVNSTQKNLIFGTDGLDPLVQWDGTSATFVTTTGNPPKFIDIAAISDHVIGVFPPYTIGWCNNQDPTTWPTANSRTLSTRGDRVVAIRPLGQYGGVVYKSDSLWTIFPQGGAESTFFVFQDRGSYEGPAGVSAVIDANGIHLWMTNHGRIGMFDGTTVRWVADGIWPIVRDGSVPLGLPALDRTNAAVIFGVWDPLFEEVNFYYPRIGDNGLCFGQVTIILPRPADGIMDYIGFPGVAGFGMTTALDTRLDTHLSLVADAGGNLYYQTGMTDLNNGIAGFLHTGLVPTPGFGIFSLDALELYANRGLGFGTATLRPVTSYVVDSPDGTLTTGTSTRVDLTAATTVYDPKGTDVLGRFFGVRVDFTTPSVLKYYGARVGASPRKG